MGRRVLHRSVPNDQNTRRFFEGKLLEYYARAKTTEVWDELQLDYDIAWHVEFDNQDGTTSELDLVCLVEGNPLLIECTTTRSYYEHFNRAAKHAECLDAPSGWVFAATPALPQVTATLLTKLGGMVFTDLSNFPAPLGEAAQSPERVSHPFGVLRAMLNKASLRPLPEIGTRVLEAVLTVATEAGPGNPN